MMLGTHILGSGSVLPGRLVPTSEVCAKAYPHRTPQQLEERTGIASRWWAHPGTTRAEVSAQALDKALAQAKLPAGKLERIIYVDSTGGDRRLPATSNAVAEALGLEGSCDCIDLNNACVGFLSAMDWAARCTATGLGPVAVVTTELWSHVIDPSERRTYAVFGDASVATIFGPARGNSGVVASWLRNDGRLQGSVSCRHAGSTCVPEFVRFQVSGSQIGEEATDAIVRSMHEVLDRAAITFDEVRWVLPHQPNGRMLTTILERIGLDPSRTLPLVREVGSVGAASVPLALDRLIERGDLNAGDLVLLSAVGAGIGFGSILYRAGE
ncbi:MAG: ketoacyl-ACP synthase III [Myxococcota bacterium]